MRYIVFALLLAGCHSGQLAGTDNSKIDKFASLLSASSRQIAEKQDTTLTVLAAQTEKLEAIKTAINDIEARVSPAVVPPAVQSVAVPIVTATEAVPVPATTPPVVGEVLKPVAAATTEPVADATDYVVDFYAPWCTRCVVWSNVEQVKLQRAGIRVRTVDIADPEQAQWKAAITPQNGRIELPVFWIVDGKTRTRRKAPVIGYTSGESLIRVVRGQSAAISHNCSDACTCGCVAGGTCVCGSTSSVHVAPALLPVVNTQWGYIDLQSYSRNCNCPMCRSISAMQSQYRQLEYSQPQYQVTAAAAQAPTPQDTLNQLVSLLDLSSEDMLADLGCGDGRILVAAVKRYGCRGLGIERDPVKADKARQVVAAAGLDSRILIVTADVVGYDLKAAGVTAVTAYLYPEMLGKIAPSLAGFKVVASPYHAIPGLNMQKTGDVYVFRSN